MNILDIVKEQINEGLVSICDNCEQLTYNTTRFVCVNCNSLVVIKNKEEGLEFAKKYLKDRKDQWINNVKCRQCGESIDSNHGKHVSCCYKYSEEKSPNQNNVLRAWNIATEYVLLDIIPYIYGEALD